MGGGGAGQGCRVMLSAGGQGCGRGGEGRRLCELHSASGRHISHMRVHASHKPAHTHTGTCTTAHTSYLCTLHCMRMHTDYLSHTLATSYTLPACLSRVGAACMPAHLGLGLPVRPPACLPACPRIGLTCLPADLPEVLPACICLLRLDLPGWYY